MWSSLEWRIRLTQLPPLVSSLLNLRRGLGCGLVAGKRAGVGVLYVVSREGRETGGGGWEEDGA